MQWGQLGLGCAVDVTSDGVCIRAWSPGRVRLSATLLTLASRLLCPCRFPGENTVLCCHFLLRVSFQPGVKAVSPAFTGGVFTHCTIREAKNNKKSKIPFWKNLEHDCWILFLTVMVRRCFRGEGVELHFIGVSFRNGPHSPVRQPSSSWIERQKDQSY